MSVVSAIVLFAVIWFLSLFVMLPIGLRTQGDDGARLVGTHAGSPTSAFSMKRKMKQTTLVAIPVWGLLVIAILYSGITVRDIDMFGRMPAVEVTD